MIMKLREVKFKKLTEDAIIPTRANFTDSGMDLYANNYFMLHPGEQTLVSTGIAMELPPPDTGFEVIMEGQVRPRSGLAAKHGITVVNSPGTIDNTYRGEIKVILRNEGKDPFSIAPGDRIAQLVVCPVYAFPITEVEELSDTSRGDGGFGSTGK